MDGLGPHVAGFTGTQNSRRTYRPPAERKCRRARRRTHRKVGVLSAACPKCPFGHPGLHLFSVYPFQFRLDDDGSFQLRFRSRRASVVLMRCDVTDYDDLLTYFVPSLSQLRTPTGLSIPARRVIESCRVPRQHQVSGDYRADPGPLTFSTREPSSSKRLRHQPRNNGASRGQHP